MKALLAPFAAVFLVTFLAAPTMGAGWYWDAGNGIGFAAFAGLLYLSLTSNRRIDVRAHQLLGYGVLFVAVGHACWYLLGDAVVVEFMKPGAPAYMWHGIVSLLMLGILITVALVPDRNRVHKDYPTFRYWHRVLSVAIIATATYHIVVSNFYLHAWYQELLFVLLALAAVFARQHWTAYGGLPITKTSVYVAVSVLFATVFTIIRNLPT